MLFFLLLALSVSSGVCDELYKEAGKEVSLQCGAPQNSDIEWKLNNNLLIRIIGKTGLRHKGSGHTADKVNLYGDTLKVPRLEPRDSGVYSCTQSGKQYMLHVVSVFVKPGPVLIQSSDVELHCNIEGNPNTEVEWLRPPNDQRYDAKNQKINLKSVTSSDEGKWTCKVKDLKLSVTLTVVANHQINNVSATEGDNIELPCFLPHPVSQLVLGGKWKADHLPTVSFPTLKNTAGKGLRWDGVNSSEVKYNIESLGSNFNVTLIKVQSSFAGKFVCEVEFEHGGKLTAVTNLFFKNLQQDTDGNDGKKRRNQNSGLAGGFFTTSMLGVELWIWIAVGASSVSLLVVIIGIVCTRQKNKQKKKRVRKLRSMRQPLTAKDYCQCNRRKKCKIMRV
ncbi:hemicentin-2-like isoform X2 [Danio aesculapii]|uniref:hemicentin-2-like isoform X2 n=1 Tax=Danio aesculapii TaxID=1142201 RepID=UPI0024C06195|nr:hemicentin-2-like isoform X2 [Danio aesculapii]